MAYLWSTKLKLHTSPLNAGGIKRYRVVKSTRLLCALINVNEVWLATSSLCDHSLKLTTAWIVPERRDFWHSRFPQKDQKGRYRNWQALTRAISQEDESERQRRETEKTWIYPRLEKGEKREKRRERRGEERRGEERRGEERRREKRREEREEKRREEKRREEREEKRREERESEWVKWSEVKWSEGRKWKWSEEKRREEKRREERREEKWSEEKWSEVKWSEVKWSEVKWSEVKRREKRRERRERREEKKREGYYKNKKQHRQTKYFRRGWWKWEDTTRLE